MIDTRLPRLQARIAQLPRPKRELLLVLLTQTLAVHDELKLLNEQIAELTTPDSSVTCFD